MKIYMVGGAVRDRLRTLAKAAGAVDPDRLAGHLQVLMEGAYSAGWMLGPDGDADGVASAASALIDHACGGDPVSRGDA